MTYWPWWAGALALGAVATLHAKLTGRPLGVSGMMAKVARPRDEIAAEKMEAAMLADRAALEAALLAATEAEFGKQSDAPIESAPAVSRGTPAPAPFLGNVVFLAMMVVGAAIAAVVRGGIHLHASLGDVHDHLFGGGARSLAVLAFGGLLVGFGTRMSGGCTSGHGLSGCARLVPSALVATATFVGAAVATSMLLAWDAMTQLASAHADFRAGSERTTQILIRAGLGLALGLSLGFIGFGDYAELAKMFTLQDLRLYFTFGGAVAVTAVGLRLFVKHPLPVRAMHRSIPIGAALFGIGWALAGACPGIALVQLGEGTVSALLTFTGMLSGIRLFDAINARWLKWEVGSCGV